MPARSWSTVVAVVVALDVLTKLWAWHVGPQFPWVRAVANRDLVLGAPGPLPPELAATFAALAICGLLLGIRRWVGPPGLGAALVVGGLLGNLADRWVTGVVHDWLLVGPIVLSLGDVAVLIGGTLVLVRVARVTVTASSPRVTVRSAGGRSE